MTTAKDIRQALKTELRLTNRQVSVRDTGGSVRIEIKVAGYPIQDVSKVAKRFERVSRCKASGEILGGGNTFVFVSYSNDLLDRWVNLYAGNLPQEDKSVTLPDGSVMDHQGSETFMVWRDGIPENPRWGVRLAYTRWAEAVHRGVRG